MRRSEQRLRTVLPVRVFGMDSQGKPFTCLAHTLDISLEGARLGGVSRPLAINDIVGVQRGTDKARFQVVWCGAPGSRTEGHIGVHCIQENKNIWKVVFEDSGPDTFRMPEPSPAARAVPVPEKAEPQERRRSARYACDIGLEIQVEGSDTTMWMRCNDLSRGGCYIETRSPFPVGAYLYLCLRTEMLRVRARCVVRTSHTCLGMGVEFCAMGEDDVLQLERLLSWLHRRQQPADNLKPRLEEMARGLSRFCSEVLDSTLEPAVVRSLRLALEFAIRTSECAAASTAQTNTETRRTVLNSKLLFAARLAQELADDLRTGGPAAADSVSALREALATLGPLLDSRESVYAPEPPVDWSQSFVMHSA